MKKYTTFTAKDLDFNVEDQLKKLIQWEIWDKFVKDSIINIKANPVQIDTLCDYIRMLLPSTVKVEIERTFFGCTLNMGDNHIHVIITLRILLLSLLRNYLPLSLISSNRGSVLSLRNVIMNITLNYLRC